MTLPDKLVQRVAEAKCIRTGTDWATDCSPDVRKHPECAIAAVLRALQESEAVPVPQRCEDPREQWVYALAWNECLAALAREFGDPT